MPNFVGAAKKDAAKKALRQRPVLVLFYMIGCPHCEANKPAWEEAKAKAPADTKIVEVDADATPEDEGVQGFPTMKLKKADGSETKTSGQKESGDEILKELEVPSKTGGSKRRRRTHRGRKGKLLRRTLRNYVAL
jgi:thiol-disulfide isomerase/thioredoxin